jgi:hypothetical protein
VGSLILPCDAARAMSTYTRTSPTGSGQFSVLQGTMPYQEGTVTIATDEDRGILTIKSKLTQLDSGETADISSTTSHVDDCH